MNETHRIILLLITLLHIKYLHSELIYTNCAEDETCTLVHLWRLYPKGNITFTWYKNNEKISGCTSHGVCFTYPDYKMLAVANYQLNNKIMNITLELIPSAKNKQVNISGEWRLMAEYDIDHINFTFCIQTYKKIVDETCQVVKKHRSLILNCSVPQAYPETRCEFYETLKSKLYENITHKCVNLQHKEHYLSCSCSIDLTIINEAVNRFYFVVQMYPLISERRKYISISYCIGPPAVKFDCPDEVLEGKYLNCSCYKADNCNENTTIYLNKSTHKMNEKENLIHINIEAEESLDLFCYGVNDLNWKSNTSKYCPKFRKRVEHNYVCDDPTKIPCGEHGLCYGKTQFCNEQNEVKPCFSPDIAIHKQLEECQKNSKLNVTWDLHGQCDQACEAMFGRNNVLVKENPNVKIDTAHVSTEENPNVKTDTDNVLVKENPNVKIDTGDLPDKEKTPNSKVYTCDTSRCQTALILVSTFLGGAILILIAVLIFCYRRNKKGALNVQANTDVSEEISCCKKVRLKCFSRKNNRRQEPRDGTASDGVESNLSLRSPQNQPDPRRNTPDESRV